MNKYSPNKKLEACLCNIELDLLSMCDRQEESLNEIRRYMREFPREPDYNLAQYGNLLIYYDQVRDFYLDCGYKSMRNMSDSKIWATYLRQVGYVARKLMERRKQ